MFNLWSFLDGKVFTFFGWRFWGIKRVTPLVYFKPWEVEGLDQELCSMLDHARALAGIPFIITSGLRTIEANSEIPGSVRDSSHITGNAVDLGCAFSSDRIRMVRALLQVGFVRIGIYRGHLHVDNSLTLPQNVMWYASTD